SLAAGSVSENRLSFHVRLRCIYRKSVTRLVHDRVSWSCTLGFVDTAYTRPCFYPVQLPRKIARLVHGCVYRPCKVNRPITRACIYLCTPVFFVFFARSV